MSPKEIERAAYIAAYRVLTADTSAPELACAGARRTHATDVIAGIIKDTFDVLRTAAEVAPMRPEGVVGRPTRVLVEIPQRPSNRCEEPLVTQAIATGA